LGNAHPSPGLPGLDDPDPDFFDTRGKEVKRHIGFMDKAGILKELKLWA
jgi:hypothetical protein